MQSLEDIPAWFAAYWDISLEAGQAILSVVVIFIVLLPTIVLLRGKNAVFVQAVLVFLVEAFLIGIGWMPFWLMIGTVAVMAIAIATLGTNAVFGGS